MEFEPLYPAGLHDITFECLDDIFVVPFENNIRRQYLTERFKALIEKFSELGLSAEIWLDGSYSTQKPEPTDIDMVFFLNPIETNSIPPEKLSLFNDLFNKDISKFRYGCDIHKSESNNINLRSYWRGWFGFSRDECPKGIIRFYYGVD